MLSLFLKLLLSHMLGDFMFQPKSWIKKRKDNILYLLLHVMVHILILLIILYDTLPEYWIMILFIGCSHLAIDSLKIWWEKLWPYKPVLLFILDQFIHATILISITFYIFGIPSDLLSHLLSDKAMLYALALIATVVVSPIFLRVFFTIWNKENDYDSKKQDTLMDAGMLIGIMERLIIVLFIQVGFLSGIGFLLAAKSIFRFGDLTNAKDTKFTEYILVGTLASFLIAIFIGYMLRLGLKHI